MAVLAFSAMAARALGLGEIEVDSHLNQRFSASIPLTEISSEDLEAVTVTLAPNESFERAGVERGEYLSSLSFAVKSDHGSPRVVVTSSQIAHEPVVNLVVQARWKRVKIQREYIVLLDLPASSAVMPARPESSNPTALVAPIIAAPSPAPNDTVSASPARTLATPDPEFYQTGGDSPSVTSKPKPAVPSSHEVAAGLPPAMAVGSGEFYGPVLAQETLWSIAIKLRPDATVTMDQMQLALALANPEAINRGVTVSKGSKLTVPTPESIRAVGPAAAKTRLAMLRSGHRAAVQSAAPANIAKKKSTAVPASKAAEKPVEKLVKKATEKPDVPAALSASKAFEPAAVAPQASVASKPPAVAVPMVSAAAKPTTGSTAAPAVSTPVVKIEPAATTAIGKRSPIIAESAEPVVAPTSTIATAVVPAEIKPDVLAPAQLTQTPLPVESEFADIFSRWGMLIGLLLLAAVLGLFGVKALRNKQATAPKPDAQIPPPRILVAATASKFAEASVPTQSTKQGTQVLARQFNSEVFDKLDSTLDQEPELAQTLRSTAKRPVVQDKKPDFNIASQVQAQPQQIILDGDDLVLEADSHLAYGLYDEAILLLKQAAAKSPNRTDIWTKLAETYFAAVLPTEFLRLAEELKNKITPSEWSKLSIMGAQLCPNADLFRSDAGRSELSADFDFDLVLDEPTVAVMAASLPPAAQLSPLEATVAAPAGRMSELKVDLKDRVKSSERRLSAGSSSISAIDDEASIDFMLGQSITPLGATPVGASVQLSSQASKLEFDLGPTDLKLTSSLDKELELEPEPELAEEPLGHSTLTPMSNLTSPSGAADFSLADLEVSITPRNLNFASPSDEFDTKLDLARAYVEMGDNEMALGLLQEVKQQGSDRQKQEAEGLMHRIPG